MQSKMADFDPGLPPGDLKQTTLSDVQQMPPSGELYETRVFFYSVYSVHYMKTWRRP